MDTERDRNLTELRERFETDKKEKEIAFLNMKNELNVVNMQASRRQSTFLFIGLILFAGVSIVLFKLFRKIKNQHQTISITLKEKDTLLREIHHRVKNNLQVISSLLSLQSKYILDEHALDALRQGQDRVRSMALIHQDLYQSNNLQGVNARIYLTKLLENLLRSYNIREDEIRLEIQVDPIQLDVDTMIPLGLMMNELISNALKHAFKTSKDHLIRLILTDQGKDLYVEIADNGTGVDDLEAMQHKSFGFSLIKMFATKLKAQLDIENQEGFRVKMKIRQFQKAL
ncbi:MAG: sensor histidine kinase [Saprospiraceae bacterium]|nr:sensor histidine kinase [Saprospiraceae bacterium]